MVTFQVIVTFQVMGTESHLLRGFFFLMLRSGPSTRAKKP